MRVRIVAAFPGAAPGRLARGWMRAAPPDSRWAVLVVGALQDLDLDRAALDQAFGARVHLATLASACECCVSLPVLSVTLGRLMRAGPFDDLLVLADARGHLDALSQTLAKALPRALPSPRAAALRWEAPLGLMTPAQQVLLTDKARAGHEAAGRLARWAGAGLLLKEGAEGSDDCGNA